MRTTALAAGAALAVLVACGSPPDNPGADTSAPAVTTTPAHRQPVPVAAPPQTPVYSVIDTTQDRSGAGTSYVIVIDPVDPRSDAFKNDVKLVLADIATTVDGAHFSARIFDDRATATSLPNPSAPDAAPLREQSYDTHLVAWYAGGDNTGLGFPYDINWYPYASPQTPTVGRYIGSEEWKPL